MIGNDQTKWMRITAKATAIAVPLVFAGAVFCSASAYILTGYITNTGPTINGATAKLTALTGFNPDAGHCIVQTILVQTDTSTRQLEAGFARCNASTIDGTCSGGDIFVERKYADADDAYFCYPHGTFTNGTQVTFTLNRSSLNTDTFIPYINGTPYNTQGGFTTHSSSRAWAERTGGGPACNGWGGGAHMRFNDFQRLTSNWAYVSGSNPFNIYYNPDTGVSVQSTCFTLGDMSGTGDFDVTK